MKENVLQTTFVFDDRDGAKVESLHRKLLSANNDFNNLGRNTAFGKIFADHSALAAKSVDSLKTKIDALRTTTETQTIKPTVSRYWQTEAAEVNKSVQKIKNAAKEAYAPAQPLGFSPPKEFGKPDRGLFADAEKARLDVQKLNGARLDAGSLDGLTKAGVRLHDELGRVQTEIKGLNAALAKTSDKNVIKILNQDLSSAEEKFSKLSSRVNLYNARQTAEAARSEKFAKLQNYGALAGQMPGVNGEAINAALNLAQDAPKITELTGLGTAALATVAGIAVAGYGVIKVTEHLRDLAEKRLKREEQIAAAMNRQALAGRETIKSFERERELAARSFNFGNFLPNASVESLKTRRDTLEKLLRGNPWSENADVYKQEILAIENRLRLIPQEKSKLAGDAFSQRWEDWKKSQENAALFEDEAAKRREAEAEKFRKSVEEGKAKIKELGKAYAETFDDLYRKRNRDNPFASVFTEADKSLKLLRENLKGLPTDLQNTALAMQNKLNADALFSARLDNALNVFDLQDSAAGFRNFRESPLEIKDKPQFFKDYIDFYGGQLEKVFPQKQLENTFGAPVVVTDKSPFAPVSTGGTIRPDEKPFAGFAKNATFGGSTQYDSRDSLLYAFDRLATGGTLRRERKFEDLSETDKRKYLDSVNRVDQNKNLSLQNRLDKQFAVIDSLGAGASDEQLSLINRKITVLTQGVDPSSLRRDQRERAALAREQEAAALANAEKKAQAERAEELRVSKSIEKHLAELVEIAKKEGVEGVQKAIVEIVDKSNGAAKVLGASPKPSDMPSYFDQ